MSREEGGGDGGERSCGKDRGEGRGKAGETEDARPPGAGKGMDRKRGIPPKGTSGEGEMRGRGVSRGRGGRREPQDAKALRSKGWRRTGVELEKGLAPESLSGAVNM